MAADILLAKLDAHNSKLGCIIRRRKLAEQDNVVSASDQNENAAKWRLPVWRQDFHSRDWITSQVLKIER